MKPVVLKKKRSDCPVACSLDIMGDKWTLLIIRDLYLGKTRFKDFVDSSEKIPTNILSERLERLLTHRVIEKTPLSESSKRKSYQLTERGEELVKIMKSVAYWGMQNVKGTRIGIKSSQ